MNVLVDTSVWSLALRRASRSKQPYVEGIQGSTIDFLICAIAVRRELSIFTTDVDFTHYARVLSLQLHTSRE